MYTNVAWRKTAEKQRFHLLLLYEQIRYLFGKGIESLPQTLNL